MVRPLALRGDAIFSYTVADTTDGGTATAGPDQIRPINTVDRNEIGASLSVNEITLLAGTYWAEWSCQWFATFTTQTWLETDGGTELAVGQRNYSTDSQADGITTVGSGLFTFASSDVIRIGYRVGRSGTMGVSNQPMGRNAKFAEIKFWKVS